MNNIKILNSKKTFYFFLFVLALFIFLVFFPTTPAGFKTCSSSPGPYYPQWNDKISNFIDSSKEVLPVIIIAITAILVLLGFFQKGSLKSIGQIFIIILIIEGFIVSLYYWWGPHGDRFPSDTRRLAALDQINLDLEEYYSNNGKYPGVSGSNQLDILGQVLAFPEEFNDDCHRINPEWTFEYWVSPDGQKYVLKANFQDHYYRLDSDLDGNILGASCGENGSQEREYCISPNF